MPKYSREHYESKAREKGYTREGGKWSRDSGRDTDRQAKIDRATAQASKQAAENRRIASQAAQERTPTRHAAWADRPTEDISFKEEAQKRGWAKTMGAHLAGLLPGVDVQAREYANIPNQPAPSRTSFGGARFLGDILGGPGMGDLAQKGYEALGGGDYELADLLGGGLQGQPSTIMARQERDGGDTPIWPPVQPTQPTSIDETLAAQETEKQKRAQLAQLLGRPGFTQSGKGVIFTG